jgi:hypothetical protein
MPSFSSRLVKDTTKTTATVAKATVSKTTR